MGGGHGEVLRECLSVGVGGGADREKHTERRMTVHQDGEKDFKF